MMKKILILYISTTGNTEEIADILKNAMDENTFDITSESFEMGDTDNLNLRSYDGILFGTHTYDDGDLPFETDIFLDHLLTVDLKGIIVGIFGSGDTSYSYFCEAVETMKDEFTSRNATVLDHTVKVDLYPDTEEDLTTIDELAKQFQSALL